MSPESISRSYRSRLRQQQAQDTRTRVVAAAGTLFSTDGYTQTTLAKIAATAGVSAETVQGHGPKAALMIAAIEQAATGVIGEENILNLDVAKAVVAADEREHALDMLVDLATDVHIRTAALAEALAGAAGDPELNRYRNDLIASVSLQFRRVFEVFRDRGWVRDDISFDEAALTAAVVCSVETYLRITVYDGRDETFYRRWCRRMLAETVFTR